MNTSSLNRRPLQKLFSRALILSVVALMFASMHVQTHAQQQQEDPFITLKKRREELSRRAIEEPSRRQVEEGKPVGRASSASEHRGIGASTKPGVIRVMSPEEKKALAHMERGLSYFSKKQFEKAIQEYQEANRIFPDIAAVYNNLGSAQFALGSFDAAIESFKQACQLEPAFAQAHFNLGLAYLKKGRETEAAASFNHSAAAYLEAGDAHLKAGRLNEAEEAFAQVKRIDSSFYLPYLKLASVYEAGKRYAEAVEAAHQALRLQPKATTAHFILGKVYLALNQRDKAIEQHQKLKDAGDTDHVSHLQRLLYGSNTAPAGEKPSQ